LSFSCSASHEELGDGSLPFSVQALQVEKAVADLVEGLMAWRDPEPNAGTRVSCLAPLCCLALAVPPLAAPEQVQFIWRAVEQLSLSLGRRQNESPAL